MEDKSVRVRALPAVLEQSAGTRLEALVPLFDGCLYPAGALQMCRAGGAGRRGWTTLGRLGPCDLLPPQCMQLPAVSFCMRNSSIDDG